MKTKKISRVLTAFLVLALAVSLTNGALAVRGTLAVQSGVTLSETNGSPRFSIATNDGTTNLFQDEAGDFRNLMPGDTRVSKTISVRAAALNRSSYRIFLYARECEETADGLHVKSEDGKTNDQGMLDFLTVRVYQVEGGNRRLISDGLTMGSNPGAIGQNPSEAANAQLGATAAGALLGTFAPGHEVELQVELSVDIEAGNEFADKAAYIDWVFYADTLADLPDRPTPPGGGGGGGGGGTPTPPPAPAPDVEIEDPAVPLAETPPPTEEEIEDEGVPLTGMPPETGDTAMMMVWLGLAVLSGGGMIVLMTTGRRSKEKAAR